MSRVQQRLDILVSVQSQNAEALKKPISTLKELLNAQAALDRQRGESKNALAALNRLEEEFSSRLAAGARQEIELLKVARDAARAQQERERSLRSALLASANLSVAQGDLARAEEKLQAALRVTNPSLAESARIKERLIALDAVRDRQGSAQATQALQSAIAQARLARASGDTAAEIQILNKATSIANLSDRERERILISLAQAQRRQSIESERAARSTETESKGLLATLGSVYNSITRVLASAVLIGFTIRTVFRGIDRLVISPIVDLGKNVLETTDKFRQMDASLLGIAGSARAVRDLTRDIADATRDLPIAKLEAISAVRNLAFTPGVAAVVGTPGPQRSDRLQDLLRTLSGLATINPEQGIEGAQFATREAIAGQFRSLRFRFNISPEVVAASIGKSLSELKADPQLTLKALTSFVNTFVGPDALNEYNRLLSTQGKRLRGGLEEFLNLIGDQGIYDRVTRVLKTLADSLSGATRGRSPALLPAAGAINNSLEKFLDNILIAASASLQSLTGRKIDLNKALKDGDVAKLGEAVASVIESLSKLASFLILLIPDIVALVGHLTGGPTTPSALRSDIQGRRSELEDVRQELADQGRVLALLDRADRQRLSGDDAGARSAISTAFQGLDERQQNIVAGGKIARFLFGGSGSGVTDARVQAQEEIEKLTNRAETLEGTIARLTARLEILDSLRTPGAAAAGRTPAEQDSLRVRDTASEIATRLNKVTLGFTNSLEDIAGLAQEDEHSFSTQALKLKTAVAHVFDPAQPGSLASLTVEANDRIDSLLAEITAVGRFDDSTDEFIQERLKAVAKIQQAVDAQRRALGDAGLDKVLGLLHGSEGFLGQLSDQGRLNRGLDVLGLIGGGSSGQFRDQFGGGLARPGEGQFAGSIRKTLSQLGIGQDELLDPKLLQTDLSLSNEIGDSIGRLSGQASKGARATEELAAKFEDAFKQEFVDETKALRDNLQALSGTEIDLKKVHLEDLQEAIDKLDDLRKKAAYDADQVKQVVHDMASEISQDIKGGLVDSILDALNNGAKGVQDILKNMLIAIQRAVLDAIIELTIIRGLVNPLLNSSLGLGGTPGALPTIDLFGRTGMVVDSGRVHAFRQGEVFDSPHSFGMQGGHRGVLGEDGPEVILPLDRAPDGKLGLRSMGGGGAVTNVYMTVKTPDADSFRRSARQVVGKVQQLAGRR